MHTFTCKNRKETWDGSITVFKNQGDHYEFLIQSRSSIMVVFGKTTRGYFACMPDFNVGCHLARLCDVFWNTERLTKVLGKVDGITVANALAALSDILEYPEF
jgi:hypothetical protein